MLKIRGKLKSPPKMINRSETRISWAFGSEDVMQAEKVTLKWNFPKRKIAIEQVYLPATIWSVTDVVGRPTKHWSLVKKPKLVSKNVLAWSF